MFFYFLNCFDFEASCQTFLKLFLGSESCSRLNRTSLHPDRLSPELLFKQQPKKSQVEVALYICVSVVCQHLIKLQKKNKKIGKLRSCVGLQETFNLFYFLFLESFSDV